MAGQDARSYGPLAVAFMALHDRAFFANLVGNPEKTLTDTVNEGTLTLTLAHETRVRWVFGDLLGAAAP